MTNVEPAQESSMEQAALEAPVLEQQRKQELVESETAPKVERVFDARQQRINELRLKFCVRDEFPITKNMIHSDGTLNQEYVSQLALFISPGPFLKEFNLHSYPDSLLLNLVISDHPRAPRPRSLESGQTRSVSC